MNDKDVVTFYHLHLTILFCLLYYLNNKTYKVKLSLKAVEAHKFVRLGGPTFSRQSAHRRRSVCQPYAPTTLYPQEDILY
jgi:hypothetical protein